MTDIILGVLHMCIFPGGLFALAVGLLFKGLDRRVEARLQRRVGILFGVQIAGVKAKTGSNLHKVNHSRIGRGKYALLVEQALLLVYQPQRLVVHQNDFDV